MNTEEDEFNRIERESKARMLAVEHALRKISIVSIPEITQEEWDALNAEKE